jgi:cobalt/nickel transport system permease protein
MENAGGDKQKGLPGWLMAADVPHGAQESRRAGYSFIRRTLLESARFMEDLFFNETVCRKKGFMQSLEPRVKLIVVLLMVFAVSLMKSPAQVMPLAAFALLCALSSGVPMGLYARRVLPGVLLTVIVAAPAIFSPVLRGQPLVRFFSFSGHAVFITRQGTESALTLVARVAASLMLVALAGLTTKPSDFIRSGAALLPGSVKTLFSVSYRYIYLLVLKLEEFSLASRARIFNFCVSAGRRLCAPGGRRPCAPSVARRWVGSRGAGLMLLALSLKDDLSMSLEARGAGRSIKEPPQGPIRLKTFDFLFIAFSAGVVLYAFI